ncbi:hypothetical protein ACFVH9_33860 [Streptomyces hirsutus]|uniref:hypothetical protein n=1 Tax=Streptomyces hirsutus TaxID=35620 RepID=UPI00362DBE51
MAPKDKKRRSSPTGSDGSGQSSSSTSSMGLEQLFATLPPSPPSERALSRAPALALDPESLRAIPERTPWTPGDGATWLYRAGNKVLTGIVSSSSSAAKWVAENDAALVQSFVAGGSSILQGAGIAGQSAAAPAATAGQGVYGAGVTIAGVAGAYTGIKELSKLWSNYRHPERTPKPVNYPKMALDLATAGFAGVYGGYSTGAEQNASAAQMGMAVGAIGAGVTAAAAPWFQSPEPAPAPTYTPTYTPTSYPAPTPLGQPYHPSMTSLAQQFENFELTSLPSTDTRNSSVSTGSNPHGTYPPAQNPVSGAVSSYSYYPTDGQNSQQQHTSTSSTTSHRRRHHHQPSGGNGNGQSL